MKSSAAISSIEGRSIEKSLQCFPEWVAGQPRYKATSVNFAQAHLETGKNMREFQRFKNSSVDQSLSSIHFPAPSQKLMKKRERDSGKEYKHGSNRGYCYASVVSVWDGNIESGEDGSSSKTGHDSTKYFDFVVIGSGVAGLRYALDVVKFGSVAVITKAESHESNTNYAQGGVSAVLDPADSIENHIRDTIVAGAYLCDEETVEVVCREGPDRVKELMAMGASFDHSEDGRLQLAREGGHSHHRIVHAADMTGREIERALLTAARNNPKITMFEHHFAVDFLTRQDGTTVTCHGVDTLDTKTNQVNRFIAGVTLLASGGAGHIYPSTTNPIVATGDGVAMAHRAHAVISNMEFVQFHPTALADDGLSKKPESRENAFLITEAVRGDGGILYNQAMERFMPLYDDRGELAPRDVVARSIDDQLKKRKEKYVYLDISHKPREEILSHFPNIAVECLKYGLDITKQPIPVVPAAHYMCGGVQTGLKGETSISGLYAAGEVTCTGLHGANRLASNSLLEALVFAQRAIEPSVAHVQQLAGSHQLLDEETEWPRPVTSFSIEDSRLNDIISFTASKRKELQEIMWDYVGIVRSTECLKIAEKLLDELEFDWEDQLFRKGWEPNMVHVKVCEMRNLISVANLVVSSALARQESRGLHYTTDYPELVESKRLPTVLFPSTPVKSTWSSQLLHRLSLQCASLPSGIDDISLSKQARGGRLVARAYVSGQTCRDSVRIDAAGFAKESASNSNLNVVQ